MKISETVKVGFKVLHTSIAIICLAIIGVFIYEKHVIAFDSYVDTFAVVSSKAEFEADEPIAFFALSANEEPVEVELKQMLMCDYGDGNGFGFISSQKSIVEFEDHDLEAAKSAKKILSSDTRSDDLLEFIHNHDISDFIIFGGDLPHETSQCFVKFKFSKETQNFKITKSIELISSPFDYIWYFSPTSIRK